MQFSYMVISLFIVIKVVRSGCQQPPPRAHPDNSHDSEESLNLGTDVPNSKLSMGTIAFFGVIIIGSYTEHYTQYACSQTGHSTSYRDSSLSRENILTGRRTISAGLYKVAIPNPNSNTKLNCPTYVFY